MISLHSPTHSSQIKTVGPAISLRTSCWPFPQNEQKDAFLESILPLLLIMGPPSRCRRRRQLNVRRFSVYSAYQPRQRCQSAIEKLGTFWFQRQPAACDRFPRFNYVMIPSSKRKVSRVPIRSSEALSGAPREDGAPKMHAAACS